MRGVFFVRTNFFFKKNRENILRVKLFTLSLHCKNQTNKQHQSKPYATRLSAIL